MNRIDLLSWLFALLIVGTAVAGAFFTLSALLPEAQSIELPASEEAC